MPERRNQRRGRLGALAVALLGLSAAFYVHFSSAPAPKLARSAKGLLPTSVTLEEEAPAPPPAPFREPTFPFLDDEDANASVSVGDTSHGWVVNAAHLAESEACAILPRQRDRDLSYGTSELITLIEHAATALHTATGTRLWVGNIGKRGGGDIRYSISHNAGRDADIALSYLDASGTPVDPPDLIPLDAEGASEDGAYRFDPARTWIVVKSLLGDDAAQVQYIFLSDPLKRTMLRHAREAREPGRLIARAQEVVKQPGGALPHNDHLHVRIACGRTDVLGGCVDAGPIHPWFKAFFAAKTKRAREIGKRLEDDAAEQRKRAIERLVLLDANDHADAVGRRLQDVDSSVRAAAAKGLGALGEKAHVVALAAQFEKETDPRVARALLAAASTLGGEAAGTMLKRAIERPIVDSRLLASMVRAAASPLIPVSLLSSPLARSATTLLPEAEDAAHDPLAEAFALRLAAIDAAGVADRTEPTQALLDRLSDPDVTVRSRAEKALARVINRSFGAGWDDASWPQAERDQSIATYRSVVSRLPRGDRDRWLALGFTAQGYRVPRIAKGHAWEILRAVNGNESLTYNAEKTLVRLTKRSATEGLSKTESCRDWLRWMSKHRRELGLPKAPTHGAQKPCP